MGSQGEKEEEAAEEEKEEEEKEEELSICSGKMTEPITFCGPNVSNLFDK